MRSWPQIRVSTLWRDLKEDGGRIASSVLVVAKVDFELRVRERGGTDVICSRETRR